MHGIPCDHSCQSSCLQDSRHESLRDDLQDCRLHTVQSPSHWAHQD
uniref:Uncharacterized protein n=1 Tax=Rhizophora mucronata TaxID=61149 RepID=A0A2P2QMS8_RHIMU